MMKTFADNAGRTWTVAVNVDAIQRGKALARMDLMEAVECKLLEPNLRPASTEQPA